MAVLATLASWSELSYEIRVGNTTGNQHTADPS